MTAATAPETLVRISRSVPELFLRRVHETPDRPAYQFPVGDAWQTITWGQVSNRVHAIAGGLLALGLAREQRVAMVSATRVEWILCDLGVLCAGGATTTIYPSSTAEETAYIITDSDSKYAFVEDASQLAKLRAVRSQVRNVILIDGEPEAGDAGWAVSLAELERRGNEHLATHPLAIDQIAAEIQGEQLATLIYTSGTTGKPKGVRLVHECWAYAADAQKSLALMRPDDIEYLWLPLSHSFGKVLLAGQLATGHQAAVDGRIPKLVDNLAVVRPTFMAAAPRIFEKVHAKVVAGAEAAGGAKAKIFAWAIRIGREASALRERGRSPGPWLAMKLAIARRLVYSKLQQRFGGRLRFFISGSAPLSTEIATFFHACDILILEGYGLTESSAASFVNRPEAYRFGTVGLPFPGTEVKLAEDGEILIKSPGVMRGYHNLPEQTAEVLRDGWLHTGDIGEIDADGFLKITDRKKDLIKTSNGKYVAPQHVEGTLKTSSALISQMIVHGDKRTFISALITLDPEALAGRDPASPEIYAEIQAALDEANPRLARHEQVKKFAILPTDLTVEAGELTPSLKVKRKAVEKKYAAVLDALYAGGGGVEP